jgi:hypothetical protein
VRRRRGSDLARCAHITYARRAQCRHRLYRPDEWIRDAARATRRRGASALEKRSLGVVEFITADHFRSIGSPCGAVASSRRRLRCLPQVTIISEGFARKLWPEFPKVIGLHLLININTTRVEIVGDIR